MLFSQPRIYLQVCMAVLTIPGGPLRLGPIYYLEEEDNLNGIEVQAIKTAVSTAVNALSDAQSIDGGLGLETPIRLPWRS